jgi:gliding motility-associated-like protein
LFDICVLKTKNVIFYIELMVRIAETILFFICLQSSYSLYAQVRPKACVDLLPDYQNIGSSVLGGVKPINCGLNLPQEITLLSTSGQIDNASIFIGIDDNFDLATAGTGLPITATQGVNHTFTQGKTWVLMKGEQNGSKVLSCQAFEFLPINAPTVASDLCAGNPISLKISDTGSRDGFRIDWGDGNAPEDVASAGNSTPATHTYSYFYSEIKVQAFYKRNNNVECISAPYVVKRDVPKSVFLSVLEGGNDATEFRVRYVGGDPAIEYKIEGREEGSVNWQNMSVAEAGEGQVIGLNSEQKYCFRLKTENACGESFYSQNTLCSIVVDREVLSSTSMKIHWNIPHLPAETPLEMKLRNRLTPTNTIEHSFSDPTTTEFVENNLLCGQQYYYQVEANYPPVSFEGNDVAVVVRTSFVPKEISQANVNSKPPYMATASFDVADDSKVDFTVILDNGGLIDNITYYKSNAVNGTYTEVLSIKDNVYSETGIAPGSANHCFRYQIKDVCGVLTAPSDPFCTINLHNFKKDSLVWNGFIAPGDVFLPNSQPLYHIEYFNEDTGAYELVNSEFSDTSFYIGNFIDNLTNPVLKLRILLNQSFSLEAFDNIPIILYSNSILHTLEPRIYAPSVFTPNGSGPLETESFKVFSKFVKSGNYKILDRSGNLLFESKDMLDAWDGRDQREGKSVPIGTYFYIISAVSYDNKSVQVKGSVSVLK